MGKAVITAAGVLVLVLCVGIYGYHYGSKGIHISSVKLKKKQTSYDTATVDIISNFGTSFQIRMAVAIPCGDKKQFSDVDRNLPRIKDALLTSIDPKEMKKLIDERDFNTIKQSYRLAVNRFLQKPVEAIYITSFNY
jgi:flagellar basal body-associated protein FliL